MSTKLAFVFKQADINPDILDYVRSKRNIDIIPADDDVKVSVLNDCSVYYATGYGFDIGVVHNRTGYEMLYEMKEAFSEYENLAKRMELLVDVEFDREKQALLWKYVLYDFFLVCGIKEMGFLAFYPNADGKFNEEMSLKNVSVNDISAEMFMKATLDTLIWIS